MPAYDAILPAGGRIGPPFSDQVGTTSKALIVLDGETILSRILRSLRDSGTIGRIVVIGTEEVRRHPDSALADHLLPEGASGPDNIFRGLDFLLESGPPPDKVVVMTTDLPFVDGEIMKRYLSLVPLDKDIAVPLIREQEYTDRFPGSSAMFVKLRDGSYTLGGAFVMGVQALQSARPHIERVFENRKSKLGMAKLLGPAFVAKWVTGRLTLTDVEKKIESMLGLSGKAVHGSPPELAYDVDYQDDYDYARTHIEAAADERIAQESVP